MDNNMNKGINAGTIVGMTFGGMLVAIFILVSVCKSNYNSMVDARNNVKKAKADVENMIQRRFEQIPDLVETVKAHTAHGEKVYTEIANARKAFSNALNTDDLKAANEANEALTIAVDKLATFVNENYPELKTGETYIALMDEISGAVNRISTARRYYNNAVFEYNNSIEKFPKNIFASIFGFEKAEEFKADEEAHKSNLVDFSD